MDMRINVGGDAETGWLVDIHDGWKQGCYSPAADTPELAACLALQTHAGIAQRAFEFPGPDPKAMAAAQKATDQALKETAAAHKEEVKVAAHPVAASPTTKK